MELDRLLASDTDLEQFSLNGVTAGATDSDAYDPILASVRGSPVSKRRCGYCLPFCLCPDGEINFVR